MAKTSDPKILSLQLKWPCGQALLVGNGERWVMRLFSGKLAKVPQIAMQMGMDGGSWLAASSGVCLPGRVVR